ncbi:restriction endonuclease subunit S [Acetobacterium wieringae]|uniref:restriction endonuclease subunit S n=1 Tax=Acetobacterium wieringae TaxID=52694 RepID=UPI002034590E|nr:restriction endonuclease subunit S [Acetobacterium wieringae]URN83742.1 restriction endonuclease subunit S [Acetobacterium wieringae]
MAKKKQELTVEEKLAEALVREDEQPYKVPGNWVWTRLGSVITLISGRDVATNLCNDKQIGIPYILGASNINDDKFNIERWIEKPVVVSKKNDLLISVKGTVGKIYLQNEDEINISRQIMALRASEASHNKYLEYFLFNQINYFKESANGLIPGISRETILECKFPLPPLAEQQRIVDRIESLFDQLDQAKALIQEALDSFETRKAAILHQAFTGALTKKWREEHIIQKHLEYKKLIDITTKITDGFHNSPSPQNIGYPYVMAGNVKETGINFNSGLFMDEKNHRELYNKAHPKKGDILLVNIGAGSGTSAVIDVDFEFSFKNSAILKLKEDVNPYYVNYYLQYTKEKTLAEISKGGAQPFLSLKVIKEMKIMMLPFVEQNQVVCILDDLFAKEQAAKDLCDQIDQIDTIKKTILGKAFRGELGTNVAGEESAVELLAAFLTG